MIEKFIDVENGKRRVLECLLAQEIVANDASIAEFISENCTLREMQAGEILINENDDSDSDLHLILAGVFSIRINGREIATRFARGHVGEMALIDPSAKRSASVVATDVSVVATITESQFSKIANLNPIMWRRIAVELSHRLRERSKYIKKPNAKPMVFIGSSSENVEIANFVRKQLHGPDMEVNVWDSDGIFKLSKSALESLITAARSYDFAIMIFDENDLIESRNTQSPAPRDNVVFELGLFMGSLGAERAYILRSSSADLKIPSDLLGITTLVYKKDDVQNSVSAILPQIAGVIRKLGPN